ncbi:DUF4157 domain-containing protein [Streptomyces sp. 5K101]|uniref:eCIS core domain-containing protein n=1 Tax=Streptomyces sp. 5K101 TaxID=3390037 RepID=UPI00397617BE
MADRAERAEKAANAETGVRLGRSTQGKGRAVGPPGTGRSPVDGTAVPTAVRDQGNRAVGAFLRREARRGQPLPPSLRAGMESYFGTDLSGVRLHLSGDATRSANAVRARAYTVGQDIVFGAGEYRPHDAAGRRLIAHEVTHTVQQARGGPVPAGSDRTERAAAGHAGRWASGARPAGAVVEGSGVGIAREAAGAAPAEEPDTVGALGTFLIGTVTEKVTGPGPQREMLRAALTGFFAELKRQWQDPKVRAEVYANFEELKTSKSVGELAGGYSAGAVTGLVSPLTDLFELVVLQEHLNHFARSLALGALKGETHLIEEAQALARDFLTLRDSLVDAVTDLLMNHPEGLSALYEHFANEAVRRSGEHGRLAARKVVESLRAKEESKPPESAGQILTQHTESEKMGVASAISSKMGRLQRSVFHTRPARFGYDVGSAVGTVIANLLLMAFTEGVGTAITEIAGALGRAAPMLARAAEFLAEVGKVIATVETSIGTLVELLLKKVKFLGAVSKPFLDLMLRLQLFLRRLSGVAHRMETAVAHGAVTAAREAAPAAGSAGARAAESAAPKAAAGQGEVVSIRPAQAEGAAAKGGTPKVPEESGVFPVAKPGEHATAPAEGVVEHRLEASTGQPVEVAPGATAPGGVTASQGPGPHPKRRIVTIVRPGPAAPAAPVPKGPAGPGPGKTGGKTSGKPARPKKAPAQPAPKGPHKPTLCSPDELGTPGVTPMSRGIHHVRGAPGDFDHRLMQMTRELRASRAGVSLHDFSCTNIAAAKFRYGVDGPVEYLVSPNIPGSALGLERGFDSERLIIERAMKIRRKQPNLILDQLYTERIPCKDCTIALAQHGFSEAKIFYTVPTTGQLRIYGDPHRGRALMRAYGMLKER